MDLRFILSPAMGYCPSGKFMPMPTPLHLPGSSTSCPPTDERSATFVILGASYVTGNMGVDALLSGTVASIYEAMPRARIVLLDYHREPATFSVPGPRAGSVVHLANLRFSWKLHLRNNVFRLLALALAARAIPFAGLRTRWLARNPWLRELLSARLVLSLAGGDSFSDIYGLRRFLYVVLPQLLVLAVQCPLVLLPQTLGPFRLRCARMTARFLMSRARLVYSRDAESLNAARQLLDPGAHHLRFSPDMAFALKGRAPARGEPSWLHAREAGVPLVGVNVSGLLHIGGYSRDNMFALGGDYRELVQALVGWFAAEAGAHVVLVSHVAGPKAGAENDAAACADVFAAMLHRCGGRLHIAASDYDHREIKHLIGCCDFFIGSRMHATIAALSQGVPAIGLAYSRKFIGVFRTVDAEELVIDLRNTDTPTALARMQRAFFARHEHRQRIQIASTQAARASQRLISEILREIARTPHANGTATALPHAVASVSHHP